LYEYSTVSKDEATPITRKSKGCTVVTKTIFLGSKITFTYVLSLSQKGKSIA
jgi:hypothetical protein